MGLKEEEELAYSDYDSDDNTELMKPKPIIAIISINFGPKLL